ncbi:MAG: FadR family transcriptional regulator [Devosiaceae bacterium]|nr:FadR family transcriptional regulator [Devosiaceae bacterium MH13]
MGTVTLLKDDGQSALVQLRAFIAHSDLQEGQRLPPERDLVEQLGVTRNDLRKALALLEAEGRIWRHVGKGTFVGAKPMDEVNGLNAVAERSSPVEVMQARILIEPLLAAQAALHATGADLTDLRETADACRAAQSWREYESQDNALHRAIAVASNNKVLLSLFDTLNTIRRTVVWGRDRKQDGPPPHSHHSFDQHDAIVAAIVDRDQDSARSHMLAHLQAVQQRLIG